MTSPIKTNTKPIVETVDSITTNTHDRLSQSNPTNPFPIIRTIIQEQFKNEIFYEGAIVLFDPINN